MSNCAICGAELQSDEMQEWAGYDGKPVCYCKKCVEKIKEEYRMQTINQNIFLGLIYGILASIVTGIIWYVVTTLTHTAFDIIVIGIGFCIAYAVSKGAGNKKGWKIQLISVILALCTFIIADGMTAVYQLAVQDGISTLQYFTQGGAAGIIANIILLPRYAIAVTGFVGYACWIIGIYVAFVYAAPDKLKEYKPQ